MAAAPAKPPIVQAPSPSNATAAHHHRRRASLIMGAVLAAILFPLILILLGLSWLALKDPSTLWMLVSLYFQAH